MEQKKISLDEIASRIGTAFERMQESRFKGLKETRNIQQVKYEARMREHQRLKKKYGANHPRVQKNEQRLSFHEPVSRAMVQETERAGIDIPPFKPNSWRIHGRVLDQDRNGLKDLTVSLRDEKQQWIRELGHACTDERGYFSLTYSRTSEDEEARPVPKMFLTVSDKDKNVLHREKEPLSVVIGQIDYREIILGEEKCEEPPADGDDDKNGDGNGGDGDETVLRWGVTGTVRNARTGRGIPGLTVQLRDREGLISENLGTTKTGAKGAFSFTFTSENSPELFDKKPSVFLEILDKAGNTLHTEQEPLEVEPGKVEQVAITIRIEGRQKRWMVKGSVTFSGGERGHRGYTVNLFDKENEFTKQLGSTMTLARGAFELTYSPDDFPELFDKQPPLYLAVRNRQGKVVYTSEEPIKAVAGKVENINIEI